MYLNRAASIMASSPHFALRLRSPDAGRRDTRAAASAARTAAVLAPLYDRAGRADDAQGLPCAIRSGPLKQKSVFGTLSARILLVRNSRPTRPTWRWLIRGLRITHDRERRQTGRADGRAPRPGASGTNSRAPRTLG